MPTVADCLRQHAPTYLEQHGNNVPLGHRKVISSVTRCRTGELGHVLFRCDDCGKEHWLGRSCGNRHCPNCQRNKTTRWLEKQTSKLLPTHHFLVTFTVPQELRWLLRAHQPAGYRAIFDAGSETIRDLAASSRYLKDCDVGFFGVLHTWGRDPTVYHPHVHFVVPGGGVHRDDKRWQQTPDNFLFPHAAAIKVYKAKFADHLRGTELHDEVETSTWWKKWNVDIQPVGDGKSVLKYLAPYVHRVAISDNRIVACDARSVTFRFTPSGKRQSKTRTVAGTEFVRGFVQHTLPSNFQKVRYYGWMSPNSRLDLEEIRWLLWLFLGWTFWLASHLAHSTSDANRKRPRCSKCGGTLQTIVVTDGAGDVLFENALDQHALDYLDSG